MKPEAAQPLYLLRKFIDLAPELGRGKMYPSMNTPRSSTPGKIDIPGQSPSERDLELELEVQAWVELLLDYYDYKRQRKVDAGSVPFKMDPKVDL
jgi:hypothetical protein